MLYRGRGKGSVGIPEIFNFKVFGRESGDEASPLPTSPIVSVCMSSTN